MLDLVKISDLNIDHSNLSGEVETKLSDVIRSLSTTISEQGADYLQRYISLQTFDNNGDESTSQVRKSNAVASLQQKYSDINIHGAIKEAQGVQLYAPDCIVSVTKENQSYDFGFNGNKIVFEKSLGNGRIIYHYKNGDEFKFPSCEVLVLSTSVRSQYFSVGNYLTNLTLHNDGTTTTKMMYVWLITSASVMHDDSGYTMESNLVIYRVNEVAEIYVVPHVYTNTPDVFDNLVATYQYIANYCQDYMYISPSAPGNLTFWRTADSAVIRPGCVALSYVDARLVLPLPFHLDNVLNTNIGRRALAYKDLPTQIAAWMRYNS